MGSIPVRVTIPIPSSDQTEGIFNGNTRWVWRSWLARQIVALEAEGSSPFTHPIKKDGAQIIAVCVPFL